MRGLALILSLVPAVCFAQSVDFTGFWNTRLDVHGQSLRLELHLSLEDSGLTGFLKSPDQNQAKIPLSFVNQQGDSLFFNSEMIQLSFKGQHSKKEEVISGYVKQGGLNLPATFTREELEVIRPARPQTPEPPFNYSEETFHFEVAEKKFKLEGTLTTPNDGTQAAVVLVSGSGPQNRDSEAFGHRIFAVWADHLSERGIAVLRYDERGVGASEGEFGDCTSLDFAHDALAAYSALKDRFGADMPVGIIGHSEGGLVAAIAASINKELDFIVSLAGLGVSGTEVLYTQGIDIAMAEGMTRDAAVKHADRNRKAYEIIAQNSDAKHAEKELKSYLAKSGVTPGFSDTDEEFEVMNKSINTKWMRFFLSTDSRDYWSKVNCPVLAINGSKDQQVSASENLRSISFALRRNKNNSFKTEVLPNHNHLFQQSETGALSEYNIIEETVSEIALNMVSDWVLNLVKH